MDYFGKARSNYFKVKSENKFIEWCGKVKIDYERGEGEWGDAFAIFSRDDAGFNSDIYDESTDKYVNFDIVKELMKHLDDNSICILIGCGFEGFRYMTGYCIAFNNKEVLKSVDLYDTVNYLEKKFPEMNFSLPEY